ncbi:accessory Sec system protein Asp3 [Streptococcus saliviloxodontae]|uniref:Accessory secretory protein Asp3 n=1 Tax=Streptococcus saliviloxodontae TaxID=1349416 RepID=A0ABS2PM46_9STRE|nr:accessory Sec system protein Asp3 [Streptococcus saliviloxodontae]MBM7636166.1 accessory secretory protein Asp3 [Streptococcus saliviloxodontae]
MTTRTLLKRLEWTEMRKDGAYLYGSKIDFYDDYVVFDNERLASGKPIVSFVSRTNYQGNRFSPQLPLLEPGKSYELVADLETSPANRYYLELDFFNRQNEGISSQVLRVGQHQFTCPDDTFTYQITVRSAGCHRLQFRNLALYQEQEEVVEREQIASYQKEDLPEELDIIRGLIGLE